MEIHSSGSAILYLQSEMTSPQKKCLSVITLDTTVCLGDRRNTVSRVLFQTRELTEFCSKLGVFREKLCEFALAHK